MTVEIRHAGKGEYPGPLRMLVAGYPGVSKTKFAANFPKPVFAFCGGCGPELAVQGAAYGNIQSEGNLFELVEFIKDSDYKTLVIDTLDGFQNILLDNRLKDQHRAERKVDDYVWLEQRLRAIFTGLVKLPQDIVVLASMRDLIVQETSVFQPAIIGSFNNSIHQFLTHSLWLKANVAQSPDERTEDFYLLTEPTSEAEWVKDYTETLSGQFTVDFVTDHERIVGAVRSREFQESWVELFESASSPDSVEPESTHIGADGIKTPSEVPTSLSDESKEKAEPTTTDTVTTLTEPSGGVSEDSGTSQTSVDDSSELACTVCGNTADKTWVDLSKLRFGAVHCADCFKKHN